MSFQHLTIQVEEPTEVYIEGKRHYQTPKGEVYPSITTLLSAFKGDVIQKWRERVGEEEANKIVKKAQDRGNELHSLLERYIQNEDFSKLIKEYGFHVGSLFQGIKNVLDRKLGKICLQERRLYSDVLKVAGRVDLIAEWDGVLSIIDFKGSNRFKKEDQIDHYYMQASGYALMCYERTGHLPKQIIIMIASDNGQLSVVIRKSSEYIDELMDLSTKYHGRLI